MPEHLMGIAEIAELLGVTRARVHQLRQQGALPAPYDSLAMGPVWLRADIETWARETGRIS
ncbi:helix-turn-helix transcriptional regulator [Nocardioides sp. J54]|uniref:helix-turn-helix transcriptional regulator n=1 Tax=Nocardioides sp. J54 TaxID=935866 RepID=UPI00049153FD|nr:helix-turn-helix domain-containing protein [Nocardioides sp. J54]